MKKQYVIPAVEVVTVEPVLMQGASGQRSITVSDEVKTSGFADGKETEMSSGSIWGEEE